MKVSDRLVWIELATSGPDPETDRIERVSAVITDKDLAVVAETGAVEVEAGQLDAAQARVLSMVKEHVGEGVGLLGGTRVQDVRRFLAEQMPELFEHLHYRNVDLSTLRELVRRWYPDAWAARPEADAPSIRAAIAELAYYRDAVFRTPEPGAADESGSEDA